MSFFPSPHWKTVAAAIALGVLGFVSHSQAAEGTLLQDTIVDSQCMNFPAYSYGVPTVMGEAFQQDGVATYGGWQYATYYNSARHVCVGRRQLPYGDWETIELTDYYFASNDSHNDVVIGLCPADGTIHLSYDHHNNNLHYRISVQGVITDPENVFWDKSLFPTATTSQLIPGTTVTLVTYPCFITTPDGNLLLTVRFGSSGGGDQTLYTYRGSSHVWVKNGAFTIRTGLYSGNFTKNGTDRNAYVDWTYFDPSGRLYMTWCWRETPDPLSNHDLMYAYSDDQGATWRNGAGLPVATTGTTQIDVNSPGIVGWDIPQQRGLINNSASYFDNEGLIHVMTWQLPDERPNEASFSQDLSSPKVFVHYWRGADNVWHRTPTTLTGTRAKIVGDDDGRMYLIYGDVDNVQIAMATRESGWTDWAPLDLSGALPPEASSAVNILVDYARWNTDRVLSVYAQEIDPSIPLPGATPLHVLDYHVSRLAVLPDPAVGGVAATDNPMLAWTPGIEAVSNRVYLGRTAAAVGAATTDSPEYRAQVDDGSFAPGSLDPLTTYYWRVDSVREDGTVLTGRVWSFSTPVAAPVITSATSAASQTGVPFTYQITASGSPSYYEAFGLPDGLSVDFASGLITGAPIQTGVYAVTLAATNDGGTGEATLTLTVTDGPPAITSGSVVTITHGAAFNYRITATNSPTSYGASDLPPGLSLNSATGVITGTPTQTGTYNVTLRATSAVGTGTSNLSVAVLERQTTVNLSVTTAQTTVGSAAPAVITLTRTGDSSQTIKVVYAVGGTAVNGTDCAPLSGQLKFKPGQTSKTIKVYGQGNLEGAARKTVKISLQPGTGYTVAGTNAARVDIVSGQR